MPLNTTEPWPPNPSFNWLTCVIGFAEHRLGLLSGTSLPVWASKKRRFSAYEFIVFMIASLVQIEPDRAFGEYSLNLENWRTSGWDKRWRKKKSAENFYMQSNGNKSQASSRFPRGVPQSQSATVINETPTLLKPTSKWLSLNLYNQWEL